MEGAAKVSVVIVTYNGWALLRDCLESLEGQSRPPDEVIVVDNGSRDGTVPSLQRRFPAVRAIDAGANLGFAAGNNLGIASSRGDVVVLLNNDTIAEPAALAELLCPIEEDPGIGSVAATMVFANRPEVVASTGIDVFTNGLALDRQLGQPRSDSLVAARVFGASAGAAAFRRRALEDVGGFPAAYFMYLEDVDLAWRLRLRGWESVHSSAAVVRHVYSASAGEGSAFKRRILSRNRIWMLTRCLPDWFVLAYGRQIATYELQAVGYALARRDLATWRGRWSGLMTLRARLAERRRIQGRAVAARAELEPLIRPSPAAAEILRLRRLTFELAGARPAPADRRDDSTDRSF